jgi:hypothetical protein
LPATVFKEKPSMSLNPDYDRIVTLEPRRDTIEPVPPEPQPGPAAPAAPAAGDSGLVSATEPAAEARAKAPRSRPRWVLPTAIAVVGLIASGTLGYLFYSTNAHLDAAKHQLALTTANLGSTTNQLNALQADAAGKKVTADYLNMYIADSGKVRTDYQQIVACQNYGQCRTAAQQDLADLQAFQADRQAATVPSALSSSDSQLGDSISAAIAAVQELISGMDNNDVAKVKDGFSKVDDSMLSMAKAQAVLGTELR